MTKNDEILCGALGGYSFISTCRAPLTYVLQEDSTGAHIEIKPDPHITLIDQIEAALWLFKTVQND